MKRGFSLLELCVSLGILSFVLLGIFGVFELGQSSFHFASLRQGLQSEARVAFYALGNDLRHSSFVTVTTVPRTVSVILPRQESRGNQTLDRDGLCTAGVENWESPGAIDIHSGFPNFDSFVVYYGTSEPEGRLIRQVVRPALVGPYPNAEFSLVNSMHDNPLANSSRVGVTRTLSKRLLSFRARRDNDSRLVVVLLRLRGMGGAKPGTGARADETFELTLKTYPENTYPRV
ncbi:MAG: hypothetical protein KF760_07920 [Candidatus Eremiobacteraeota bacterium]|nr:hypothetical protein [Candidatus Eremiobacteraeota bacterium]MCW5869576.1 hypothetical protein [Candidatus Eremiobacteraeota bacterium]